MKVKVCGLLNPIELLRADARLNLDFIGLIFYSKSPRNFILKGIIPKTKAEKVGVFVDATIEEIQARIQDCALDYIQLHGNETPEFCDKIRMEKPVFKAISIAEQ